MSQDVYAPPESQLQAGFNKRLKLGKVLSIIGSVLQAPVIVYFFIGLIDLIETFQSITLYGDGDPQVMAGGISQALSFLIIGTLVSIPGLVVLFYRYFYLHIVVNGFFDIRSQCLYFG